jgi:Retrotransposon gag protein/Zinc knuckle
MTSELGTDIVTVRGRKRHRNEYSDVSIEIVDGEKVIQFLESYRNLQLIHQSLVNEIDASNRLIIENQREKQELLLFQALNSLKEQTAIAQQVKTHALYLLQGKQSEIDTLKNALENVQSLAEEERSQLKFQFDIFLNQLQQGVLQEYEGLKTKYAVEFSNKLQEFNDKVREFSDENYLLKQETAKSSEERTQLQAAIQKLQDELLDQRAKFLTLNEAQDHDNNKLTGEYANLKERLEVVEKENNDLRSHLANLAKSPITRRPISPYRPISPSRNVARHNNMDGDALARALSTALGTLIIREEKKAIPIFSGSSKDKSILQWLKEAERVANANQWDEKTKIKCFNERLAGPAATYSSEIWASTVPEDDRKFKDWKAKMIEGFLTPADREQLKKQLRSLQQRPDQPMRDFISRIDELYKQVYGEEMASSTEDLVVTARDAIKTPILQTGIQEKFKNELWSRIGNAKTTFANISKAAREAEQIVLTREACDPPQSTVAATMLTEPRDTALARIDQNVEELKKQVANLKKKESELLAQIEGSDRKRDSRRYSRSPRPYYRSTSRGSRSRSRDYSRERANSRDRYRKRERKRSWSTERRSRSTSRDSRSKDSTCWKCGKVGHIRRNCRSNNKKSKSVTFSN